MDSFLLKTVQDIIRSKNRFLFLTSEKIDGDALGSTLGLGILLQKMGKEVVLKTQSTIPHVFSFLPNPERLIHSKVENETYTISLFQEGTEVDEVRYTIEENGRMNIHITPKKGTFNKEDISFKGAWGEYDAIFTFDTSDIDYLGKEKETFLSANAQTPTISIDHHASHTGYATINIVDSRASSTSEIVYLLIHTLAPELIDEEIATYLLLGIIYDTHNFQNANTTAQSLTIASELVQKGARQQDIVRQLFKNKPLGMLKVWGKVLSKLQVDLPHSMLWSSVSYSELKSTEGTEEDARASIDELMTNAHECALVALFREVEPNKIIVSLRSKDPLYDVGTLAVQFGGGGHTLASGFTLENTTLVDAETKTLEALKELYSRKGAHLLPNKIQEPIIQKAAIMPQIKSKEEGTLLAPSSQEYAEKLRSKLLGENREKPSSPLSF